MLAGIAVELISPIEIQNSDVYSERCQASMMELTILAKLIVFNIWQCSEYAYEIRLLSAIL